MAIARERNVQLVGKANLTEFAVTVSGRNDYSARHGIALVEIGEFLAAPPSGYRGRGRKWHCRRRLWH